LISLISLGLSANVAAQQPAAAAKVDLPLATKIKTLLTAMGYHKSKAMSAPGPFVIAIIPDADTPADEIREIKAAFAENHKVKIGKKSVEVIEVVYRSPQDLEAQLGQRGVGAVYLPAGTRKVVRQVLNVSRNLKLLSITSVSDYVHWMGASLGVEQKGKIAKLMINLSGCKNEGVDFDPRVLRLATVFF
jgi:hypothetical protein